MKQVTPYFLHDCNASRDERIVALRLKLGWEGYGIYWALIEHLREAKDYSLAGDYDFIAFNLRIDAQKIKSIIEDFGLFEISEDKKYFSSPRLNKDMSKMETKNKLQKEKAKKGGNPNFKKGKPNPYYSSDYIENQEKNKEEKITHGLCKTLPEDNPRVMSKITHGLCKTLPEDNPRVMSKITHGLCKTLPEDNPKEKERKQEKETFPPYTPYKEKEIKKEKEKDITSPSLRSEEVCEKTSFSPSGLCARRREEVDFKKIESLYHEICPDFPRLQRWSDARKQKVSIRFVDEMKQDWELLENIFRKMQASKFLRGDNKNGWKANFDWVFTNSTNWVKIIEGNFDNRTPTTQTPQPYATTTATYRQPTDEFHRQRDEQVYGGLFRTLVGDASER